jgi:hypothetical protein
MWNVTRLICGMSLAALAAGCGATPNSDVGPPPGTQQVTLYVEEMAQRLKLM